MFKIRILLLPLIVIVFSGCGDESQTPRPLADQPTKTEPSMEPVTMNDSSKSDQPAGKVELNAAEWKKRLTPEQYHVMREKGTEQPFVNAFDDHFEPGTYACAGCGQELFRSEAKFNSGCGWPAFYAARAGDRVTLTPDYSLNMTRTEVTCSRCGAHLGHIFDDAPQTPTGQRYCINSVSLKFIPDPPTGKK